MDKHNVALGHLKTFIIVLVVAHHSMIAYSRFAHFDRQNFLWGAPIVDSQRWLGFDLFVLFNDAFFMPLMFFLSGLFVWPSLLRKERSAFVRDRSLRLALPFAFAVTLLMPLAYYPSFLMTGNDIGLLSFWQRCFSINDWPAGPMWFIWVLWVFNLLATRLFAASPKLGDVLRARASGLFESPLIFLGALVALSAIAYFSMLMTFGPTRWLTFGPFSVWASRLLLYAVYFVAGLSIGAYGIERGFLTPRGPLARRWVIWVIAALAAYALVVMLHTARLTIGSGAASSIHVTLGFSFVLSNALIGFGMLALFLRFANHQRQVPYVSDNAYGVYLVHYVFVIWLQYALLTASLSSIEKAILVFAGTMAASFGITELMRRIPTVRRII